MGEPADEIVGRAGESDVLADLVEDHLDRHPLPVDEAEVDAVAARLEARMAPGRPVWPFVVVVLAAAAVLAVWLAPRATTVPTTVIAP
ncbi:MAG: hypothetical protein H6736_11810, partial [Alphaproteobacteria bacterium]|nr:hypothetical protein [Alphaproteobacteria bacterium]